MTQSGQSDSLRDLTGVRMPQLLYDHLRQLCSGSDVAAQIGINPHLQVTLQGSCEKCQGIMRWAREGQEVEQ